MADYTDSGLDAFLSRSIDNLIQVNLDSEGPQSTQMRYDSSQVTGSLGDTFRIGRWHFDGKNGLLILYDENNENRVAVLGDIEKAQ